MATTTTSAQTMNILNDTFPMLRSGAEIIHEANIQPYDGYVVLQDGTILRLRGDGTGTSEGGTEYTTVSRGIGEPDGEGGYDEYEVLGWVETSDVRYE